MIRAPAGTKPAAMTVLAGRPALAVTFHQARPFDPNGFRLVPQDEEQRRRRAEAMAAQAAQQAAFERIARGTTVMEIGSVPGGVMPSAVLEPEGASPPIVALASMAKCEVPLVCGDGGGGLHLWTEGAGGSSSGAWQHEALLQLSFESAAVGTAVPTPAVTCLTPLAQPAVLAVALANGNSNGEDDDRHLTGTATVLQIPRTASGGVVLVDVLRRAALHMLDAHADVVRCMCAMPDGGLATAGGKHDGTVRVWGRAQCLGVQDEGSGSTSVVLTEPEQMLQEPGYVFALAILSDTKPGSQCFALACARYNVVRICL